MKVELDVTHFATTRRESTDPNALTIRQLRPSPNGHWEAEVSGSRRRVMDWLRRNGYDEGSYKLIEA